MLAVFVDSAMLIAFSSGDCAGIRDLLRRGRGMGLKSGRKRIRVLQSRFSRYVSLSYKRQIKD